MIYLSVRAVEYQPLCPSWAAYVSESARAFVFCFLFFVFVARGGSNRVGSGNRYQNCTQGANCGNRRIQNRGVAKVGVFFCLFVIFFLVFVPVPVFLFSCFSLYFSYVGRYV